MQKLIITASACGYWLELEVFGDEAREIAAEIAGAEAGAWWWLAEEAGVTTPGDLTAMPIHQVRELRNRLAALASEYLAEHRAKGYYQDRDEWAACRCACKMLDAEIARDRAFRRRQRELPL